MKKEKKKKKDQKRKEKMKRYNIIEIPSHLRYLLVN